MYKRPKRQPASIIERPQAQIEQQKLMVRWWRTLTAISSKPLRSSVLIYKPLLWRIKRLDHQYRHLSEADLTERIEQLKFDLRREGLTSRLVVRSFAIVREVAGRELGMWHFDSQLLGGLAILHGTIGQMQTGEGKTLTATLPVATAALADIPTHLVTVNDYLTARDAELMQPIYQRLGLSTGVIVQGLTTEQRQQEYKKDITYCTNNELAFDYLKDRIVLSHYTHSLHLHALRLHASDSSQNGNSPLDRLMLRGLHYAVVDEADGVFMDEATTPLIISGEEVAQATQQEAYQQAIAFVQELVVNTDYRLHRQQRFIEFTPAGETKIEQLTQGLGPLWKGKIRRLELVKQALTASLLFIRDQHYLVDDGKVIIVDEHTGRRMPDRTWERGLHQLIELKEGCELSAPRQTLASISFQNFFRYYHHLSGMTGTADEVKTELWHVYGLPVVDVPTHKRSQRISQGIELCLNDEQKWHCVLDRIQKIQSDYERPILIGTQSVASSEQLSQMLVENNIAHQVLNARQDDDEAVIVADAGMANQVTIATSMAGRGTDIKLSDEVEGKGGLHVIITGLHESSRVDRQLYGRCARQGDQGSYEYILSLEDRVMTSGWSHFLRLVLVSPLPKWLKNRMIFKGLRYNQWRIEYNQKSRRKELLKADEQQQEVLSFSSQKV